MAPLYLNKASDKDKRGVCRVFKDTKAAGPNASRGNSPVSVKPSLLMTRNGRAYQYTDLEQ